MLPARCWALMPLLGRSSSSSFCRSAFLQVTGQCLAMARPSSDMGRFREVLSRARHVVVLTGAGVSAESGVPTFRGTGGYWRTWQSQELATAAAFQASPSRVWEFYHHRREAVLRAEPNAAHVALARCQRRLAGQGRTLTLVTQNVDELHRRAGSERVHELHGSLFKTRCTSCGHVESNYDSPITPALQGKGAPDPNTPDAAIPEELLPRCVQGGCGGLLRPHVVWFGESLDSGVMDRVYAELDSCDLCIVAGTSSVVYPAAMFAPQVAGRGVPVAEFNIETTPVTQGFGFHFEGPCGQTLPTALAPHKNELEAEGDGGGGGQ
ncbi:NAD-dependent protein deacylase sirtuin-5, mitochondrial [Lampetra fluviatilis]